jgi:tRNA uridine 5-carboxymethylaminomethyl modification enzyme
LKWICEREPKLDIKQGQVAQLLYKDATAYGVETTLDVQYNGTTLIVTTGTFLRGLMHIGTNQQAGGRAGEAAAMGLSGSLKELGIELGRLKTGTPPRLLRRTIDFSKTDIQPGDEPVPYFTYWKEDLFHVEQIKSNNKYPPNSILAKIDGQLPCYVTYTTNLTAEIIRANLHKSPMYSGVIEGVGPRYCPSIEDKIVKFPEKERQQVFLEPEGVATDEIYVNGFSTCLPFEVQVALVRTIIGCEKADIMRPAYAVEYDFAFPTQLHPSLETKVCRNLFLAGQINGTSGYEEAGAQGLMAGINAVRRVQNRAPIILRRNEAYIGVLIDDLVTKGTVEPYRMFTSRAEYRLLLRQDNADLRLSALGHEIGLLPERNYRQFEAKKVAIENELARLGKTRQGPDSLAQLLRRPEITYNNLPKQNGTLSLEVIQQVEIALKYEGYIARQEIEVAKMKTLEDKQIPTWMDYGKVPSLRTEARQKLAKIQPATLGQAARISGVSPSDVGILMIWLKQSTPKCEPLCPESVTPNLT